MIRFLMIFLLGCSPVVYTVPAGYQPCVTDWNCPKDQICWFKGVNTYAVCIDDPNWFTSPVPR